MLSAKRNYWSMQQSLKKKKNKYYTKSYITTLRIVAYKRGNTMCKYSLSQAEYVMLEYAKQFHTHSKIDDFQQFWKYRYNVNPIKLINKDLLCQSSIAISVEHFTIPQLKNILKENNLPCSGKKGDLVKRILSDMDYDIINAYFPYRYYELTEIGEQYKYSRDFENAIWVHRHPNYNITVAEINTDNPNEYAISKLKKMASYYANHNQWGMYRNARHSIADILKTENYKEHAFSVYIEICVLDIAVNNSVFRDIPPGIIHQIRKLSSNLGYLNNEYLLMSNILIAIKAIPTTIKYDNVNDVALYLKEKIIDSTYDPPENLQLNAIICTDDDSNEHFTDKEYNIHNSDENNLTETNIKPITNSDTVPLSVEENMNNSGIERIDISADFENIGAKVPNNANDGCLCAGAAIYFGPLLFISIIMFILNFFWLGTIIGLIYIIICLIAYKI